ncbi:hypothetical protein BD289DRAFT_438833 [Coniella lustricola]|uniref:Gfo/Idh/MocA-like oxidoreductase N-terminal domain-containing protein n=1 Tax=Coniella lustricola TaxID=2025994 RepID=A0A2T3A2B3_9PEZI|nr:hypothetical protein BD289DRAFT_438833 [Coniella lustricola]
MGSRAEALPPVRPLAEPGPVVSTDKPIHLSQPSRPAPSANPPRLLVIGAGSRGQAYAHAVNTVTNGLIAAVAEPHPFKRASFGRNYLWGLRTNSDDDAQPREGESFTSWTDFITYERTRRQRVAAGEANVPPGVDGVFVCVLDEMHRQVVVALAQLGGLHIMCEKPLATNLADCVAMYRALRDNVDPCTGEPYVFSIGHVLRYSPHNVELRRLLLEERVIGDVLSVVHTEPVGWWHFTHSYVRGNWRREDTTAPSLLTKSCHDIDVLLWLLCSPVKHGGEQQAGSSSVEERQRPHLPATVSSSGRLQYFKKSRKPIGAGSATNCLSCPIEQTCKYSAKRIYTGDKPFKGLDAGVTGWPVSIVLPEIEDLGTGLEGREALMAKLAEDYPPGTSDVEIAKRNWFGRCVYESDNDVLDEQVVTITWDDDILPSASPDEKNPMADRLGSRGAKQATFHMVAQTKRQCERFTRIYGVDGEIYADSYTITVQDFNTGKTTTHTPNMESMGHGGGDLGLARQFVEAIDAVKNRRHEGWTSDRAQKEIIRCTLDEVIRSHAMVFCAEDARTGKKVVDWSDWWAKEVEANLDAHK